MAKEGSLQYSHNTWIKVSLNSTHVKLLPTTGLPIRSFLSSFADSGQSGATEFPKSANLPKALIAPKSFMP